MVESGRHGKRVPEGAASACQSVGLRRLEVAREIGGVQAGVQTGLDFRVPGPDVAQQDRRVGVDAQRLGVQVALGVAGQRIGDHKWRRHQEPQLQIRMHAAGEVPVARQDGHGPDLASLRGPATRSGSGPELPMQVVQP